MQRFNFRRWLPAEPIFTKDGLQTLLGLAAFFAVPTSRDFINLWADKYNEKMIESGLPMIFRGGFSPSP